jgi:hypothetical protein
MQTPGLTIHRWLVLSPLLDGREHSFDDVRTAIRWGAKSESNLYMAIFYLHRDGLIRRFRVTTTRAVATPRGQKIKNALVLKITDKGRRAWVEFADFCAFVAQRFAVKPAKSGRPSRPETEVSRREIPIGGYAGWATRRKGDAAASAEQYRQVVEASSPPLRRLYVAIHEMRATVDEAIGLAIAGVDWKARLVRLRGTDGATRPIAIGADLEAVLREAIGDRRRGYVFTNYRGEPWLKANVYQHFRRVRRSLGFAASVKIRGWTPERDSDDPAA